MPGFVTHYLFGRDAYCRLSCEACKKNIFQNHAAYSLGQQGPDIFFYFLPSYCIHGHNIGALAHQAETNAFFRGLLKSCANKSGRDREIASAYLAGFMGHYTLDTICHPYIYSLTHFDGRKNDYFSRHAYLETDIDTHLLMEKLHRTPSDFYGANTIALTFRQRRVIASMLYDAYRYAFPDLLLHKSMMYMGIFSIQMGLKILHDNTGQKKVLFRLIEKYILGYPVFSPLIPSTKLFFRTDPFNLRHAKWTNPWDQTLVSCESFFDLYEKAQTRYLSRMDKLSALLYKSLSDAQKETKLSELIADYGNLSFHSGLDVSIPT